MVDNRRRWDNTSSRPCPITATATRNAHRLAGNRPAMGWPAMIYNPLRSSTHNLSSRHRVLAPSSAGLCVVEFISCPDRGSTAPRP
ncbi:hypothetical protein RCG67_16770, partial [Kocuria sp. CPCC 205292]|uniref:hypothetical protein n=1 Tax=Kocuria cellulosilytica TaxID=3071451 RepID=UPI0034D4FBA9